MVNVTNRSNVHMRLVALKFTLGHGFSLACSDPCCRAANAGPDD
jgi:hypothetical protein